MALVRSKLVFIDNICLFKLSNGLAALIDADDAIWLNRWDWKAKKSEHCFYAVKGEIYNGEYKETRMHRLIAHTPHLLVCHHINGFSLDNRKINLQNCERKQHNQMHGRA